MKDNVRFLQRKLPPLLACGLALLMIASTSNICFADPLPPGVQDVLKLSLAGMSDEVILAQIKSTGSVYNLTADQIIALKNGGVSQAVIKALIAGTGSGTPSSATLPPLQPVPAAQPEPVATPPSSSSVVSTAPQLPPESALASPGAGMSDFQPQLSPYGSWITVPGYGLCWQPFVTATDPSWRPYLYHGNWLYTESGWSWQSDDSWGRIVFHYGRWTRYNGLWTWVPGYDWAPAWVTWRESEGYCGWAPLPPEAVFRPGLGIYYRDNVALDVDFGLAYDAFIFVPYARFWDRDLFLYRLPHERLEFVFHQSRIANGYRVDHGRFVIEGLGRDHIGLVTRHEVRVEHEEIGLRLDFRNSEAHRGREDRRDPRH